MDKPTVALAGVATPAPIRDGGVLFKSPGVVMPPKEDVLAEKRDALDWNPAVPAKEKLGVVPPRAGAGDKLRVG